jgi:hypothetical protein
MTAEVPSTQSPLCSKRPAGRVDRGEHGLDAKIAVEAGAHFVIAPAIKARLRRGRRVPEVARCGIWRQR